MSNQTQRGIDIEYIEKQYTYYRLCGVLTWRLNRNKVGVISGAQFFQLCRPAFNIFLPFDVVTFNIYWKSSKNLFLNWLITTAYKYFIARAVCEGTICLYICINKAISFVCCPSWLEKLLKISFYKTRRLKSRNVTPNPFMPRSVKCKYNSQMVRTVR